MPQVELVLSDGKPCSVRKLGLFELDSVAPELTDPGPFFYTIELSGGRTVDAPYDLDPNHVPKRPDTPPELARRGSVEAAQWNEYNTFVAAIGHQRKRLDIAEKRAVACADYILARCMDPADKERIVNQEDWEAVYMAVLAREVTIDDIAFALRTTFQAEFEGMDILTALARVRGGKGQFAAVRQWEHELMLHLRMGEEEYAAMPVAERARKIAALKLPGWMETLNMEEARK